MFIFSFRSSKFSRLYHRKAPSKSSQGFTLCFQLLFLFVTFCLQEFSWRFYMMVHQWFIFLLEVFIEIIFRGDQVFFILHSKVQFFLPYHFRWFYVILDNLSSCFMIHMLLRMRYFKSINLFIGVILGYISPKASPKDCCYLWCL